MQRSSSQGKNSEHCIERLDISPPSRQDLHLVGGLKDAGEELKRILSARWLARCDAEEELKRVLSSKWSARCSLPSDIERTLCDENSKENTLSAEYMERLILMTLKARSWRAQDEETVDITEPRFESFSVGNVYSPGQTIRQG